MFLNFVKITRTNALTALGALADPNQKSDTRVLSANPNRQKSGPFALAGRSCPEGLKAMATRNHLSRVCDSVRSPDETTERHTTLRPRLVTIFYYDSAAEQPNLNQRAKEEARFHRQPAQNTRMGESGRGGAFVDSDACLLELTPGL